MSTDYSAPAIHIVSGGQTGVDRAALDFAIEHGLPHGGWIPKGRIAEDGPLNSRYILKETNSKGYADRTRRNARDSDGTLIIVAALPLQSGSLYTRKVAKQMFRPTLVLVESDNSASEAAARLRDWISEEGIRTLNVAGSRESLSPGLSQYVHEVLQKALIFS